MTDQNDFGRPCPRGRADRPTTDDDRKRLRRRSPVMTALGTLVAVTLVGLTGGVIASGLIAVLVVLWRVIL